MLSAAESIFYFMLARRNFNEGGNLAVVMLLSFVVSLTCTFKTIGSKSILFTVSCSFLFYHTRVQPAGSRAGINEDTIRILAETIMKKIQYNFLLIFVA